jgi:hypothetical protein
MSKPSARIVAGARAFACAAAVACALVSALAACAAFWDIEEPLPRLEEGGGADSSFVDAPAADDEAAPIDSWSVETAAPDADGPIDSRPMPVDAREAGPPGYTMTMPTPPPPFVDACSLPGGFPNLQNHNASDTGHLTLPITFAFYGTLQMFYWVNTDGVVGFDGPSDHNTLVPCPLPTFGDPFPAIYAFGDNLHTSVMWGVCTALTNTQPRQLVITWKDAYLETTGSGDLTFTVVLTETTNTIDLMYGTMTGGSEAQGSMATIGMEGSGTLYNEVSCNNAFVKTTPLDIRFTPNL